MNTKVFTEWLDSLSISERIKVLTRIYSRLTVATRELFLPDQPAGTEPVILYMPEGINELHHTLANWLMGYAIDASSTFPVETLSQQLSQIADQYRIQGPLTWSIESIRNPKPPVVGGPPLKLRR